MELIYSTQMSGFDPEKRYRNPEHFERPEAGVTEVVVVGEWPNVVEAYEHVGAEVTLIEVESRQALVVGAADNATELQALIGKLQVESDMVRAVIVGLEAGEIEKPEAGELAIRLYDALEHIRTEVDELADRRNALAVENDNLRSELEALKVGDGKEIEGLKARLDSAQVTYRANASKESLEKLVADLPEA
ncbi:hypothetical protein AEQ67_13400 [Pseudomonas sp. RIT-PI-q]|uniref:hypothetical protein n=1 Tax=Pseudomonas sp. RIT-PI-q TaxID=1690247 RepID=UPI0006CDBAFB|nr:hypothetical protein [Pseudomonas sp. RIT-PI-q]KPG98344.1 hypothetical protein AEQ67_13400 [Pseudomonas sp. RIT-PI-q]